MRYVKPLSLFQELLRTDGLERGRLMGLDVGTKYIGLSISDVDNKIALPLNVLVRKKSNIQLIADDFQTLTSELSLEGLVVGVPFDKQRGTDHSAMVKVFIDELCLTNKLEGLQYTYWDERFTTKNVDLLLKPLNPPPLISKSITDKFAAVGILQEYLDYVNRKLSA